MNFMVNFPHMERFFLPFRVREKGGPKQHLRIRVHVYRIYCMMMDDIKYTVPHAHWCSRLMRVEIVIYNTPILKWKELETKSDSLKGNKKRIHEIYIKTCR